MPEQHKLDLDAFDWNSVVSAPQVSPAHPDDEEDDAPEIENVNTKNPEPEKVKDKKKEESKPTKKQATKDDEEEDDEEEVKGADDDIDDKSQKHQIPDEEDQVFTPLYGELFERFGFGEYKGQFEDSLDGFVDFVKTIVEANSEPQFANDEVARLNEFVTNGGSVQKYLDAVYNTPDLERIDISSADNQKKVYEMFLREKHPTKSEDWIAKKIEKVEDAGLLEDEASDAYDELMEIFTERKTSILEEQKRQHEENVRQYEETINNLRTKLTKGDNIAGFPINKNVGERFFNYLTQRDRRSGKTQYQQELEQDPDKSLLMAYMMFNKFDVEKVSKRAKSEAAADLKKSLSRFSGSNATNRTNRVDEKSNGIDDFILPWNK